MGFCRGNGRQGNESNIDEKMFVLCLRDHRLREKPLWREDAQLPVRDGENCWTAKPDLRFPVSQVTVWFDGGFIGKSGKAKIHLTLRNEIRDRVNREAVAREGYENLPFAYSKKPSKKKQIEWLSDIEHLVNARLTLDRALVLAVEAV